MSASRPAEVVKHMIEPCSRFPNTSVRNLPLLIVRQCFQPSQVSAKDVEQTFRANKWQPSWQYAMFPFSHYHSNTHEALGVFKGSARLQFGGDDSAVAVQEEVQAGDVMVIPAGVGHKQLEGRDGFTMVGAYPVGSPNWDTCTGEGGESELHKSSERIQGIAHPGSDPVFGSSQDAPLMQNWGK